MTREVSVQEGLGGGGGGSVLEGFCLVGSLSRGLSVQEGYLSGRPPYGNERTVRILLECILVLFHFFKNRPVHDFIVNMVRNHNIS